MRGRKEECEGEEEDAEETMQAEEAGMRVHT